MAGIKGALQYKMFKEGKSLTRKGAMLAHCYVCNGEEDSATDCMGTDCPMYQYFHYRNKTRKKDRVNYENVI
jgi:hypothetical protein